MNETHEIIVKKPFTVNIKKLLRKAEYRFGDCDNIFILEREASCAYDETRGRIKYPRMYSAVCRAVRSVCLLLDSGAEYSSLNAEPFVRAANDMQSGLEFSYSELCLLKEYAAIYALTEAGDEKCDLRLFDNLISVLRFISDIDFDEFLSFVSKPEKVLLKSEGFILSDSDTRSACRVNVTHYAKKHGVTETSAAKKLIETDMLFEPDRAVSAYYFPAMYTLTALFTALSACFIGFLIPVFLILPFSELAKYICDFFFSRAVKPSPIPKLNEESVPDNAKTLVVFAALLTGGRGDSEIFKRLREAYYSNRGENVRFGILADLKDSESEMSASDEEIINNAKREIDKLNEDDKEVFFLFTRKRVFSESENKYIGWERKRGAVVSLVRLIKESESAGSGASSGDSSDSAAQKSVLLPYGADEAFLGDVKYVITLDSDTRLYHGAVNDMVRAMLHPANKPEICGGIVKKGHGIMQPRMDPALDSTSRTRFSMLLGGAGGSDIYSLASYETYQSLFGEGIFCGKGIFDTDAFYKVLNHAFPEETVLSHDLLEGARLNAAALTDIALTDSIPKNPLSFFTRSHRWIRGDVQALKFSGKYVTDESGNKTENKISPLSRYKLFDNLRRELSVPFSLISILIPIVFGCGRLVTALTVLFALSPILTPLLFSIIRLLKSAGRKFYSGVMPGLFHSLLNAAFSVAALPYNALITSDAVIRAAYRSLFSHRHMLQWVTASEADSKKYGVMLYIRKMLFSFLAGAAVIILTSGALCRILGIIWVLFPFIAFLSGKELAPHKINPSKSEKAVISKYALDMWHFFEDHATQAENNLPPDNYQLSPSEAVAHRTSPTNIGLYLLSCLAACDFGFIDSEELYIRVSATLNTVKKLAKWRGHLYNWYDTQTLEILGAPYISTVDSGNFITCLIALKEGLYGYSSKSEKFTALADSVSDFTKADFSPLYNRKKKLFSIGLDAVSGKTGDSCYDIFMSEARTTSYYAIASGQVPREHWRYLSRILTAKDGHIGLMSWTGTMFEFFMPALLLPVSRGSLSYEALKFCLRMQRKNAVRGVFGKSESGYFMFDSAMNYQYKAFGVQALGLKTDLGKELVISPYSSFLALKASLSSTLGNLSYLKKFGMYGKYGFFEAIDFTKSRVGKGNAVIRSYMSHHVGMSMIASANACFDDIFVKRFINDPQMASAVELLDEKIPVDAPIPRRIRRDGIPAKNAPVRDAANLGKYQTDLPGAAIISSGVMRLIACGSDISIHSDEKALNIDPFVFGSIHGMKLIFSADKIIYNALGKGSFRGIRKNTVCYKLSGGDVKAETRFALHGSYRCVCISFFAEGNFTEICPMLYFEPSMVKTGDRAAHPAYSDLSVESEYIDEYGILLFRRKRRRENEKESYLAVTFESHGENAPFAVRRDELLNLMYTEKDIEQLVYKDFPCKDGACVNPVCAIKKLSTTERGRYRCDFLIASGSGRDEVISVINSVRHEIKQNKKLLSYQTVGSSLSQISSERLCCCGGEDTGRFVSLLLYCLCGKGSKKSYLRRPASINELWSLGISGDYPIICLDITANELIKGGFTSRLIAGFISAHKYLNFSGVLSDLVIICHDNGDYMGSRMAKIKEITASCGSEYLLFRKGGIFIADNLQSLDLIKSIARFNAVIDGEATIDTISAEYLIPEKEKPEIITSVSEEYDTVSLSRKIYSVNGGAFTESGFEIYKPYQKAIWSYIYSGRQFGTLLTQNSLGYTFMSNSHEKRITPFDSDNLLDFSGEKLIMTEGGKSYDLCACSSNVTFGGNCAVYDGCCGGIEYTVRAGVDLRLPVKLIYVTLSKPAPVSYEIRPVMGDFPKYPQLIEYESDKGGTLKFKNQLENAMSGFTGFKITLSGNERQDDQNQRESAEYCFILGVGSGKGDTVNFVRKKFKEPSDALKSFDEYAEFYEKLPDLQLSSKHPELDIMINRYLPYQTLVCRMLARTGFYQSSGAYGFRDQLQDCLAIMRFAPDIARTHILRCAAHQYPEGDAMHWWHYISGRSVGVRTLCSDDYLWLPYVCAEYISHTGDIDILDIKIRYIDSPQLSGNESERFETPEKSRIKESLYMHCIRAIEHSLRFGIHGLPYMGSCDWNDGMSAIGSNGGESVWLGFFLIMVLEKFIPLCKVRGDDSAEKYGEVVSQLRSALSDCYSGDRYIRAFYGDGTPVGAPGNSECSIDILPQAFAVLSLPESELMSESAEAVRAKKALKTAYDMLFDKKNSIFKLFTPPFSGKGRYPGYISGYVEGVRENGGQYTHAAVWGAMAMLRAGLCEYGSDVFLTINSASAASDEKYRTEPYFLCGDVYSNAAFAGRGGWSLYTGAAGWYYNAVVEYLLGYRETNDGFKIKPKLCKSFDSFNLRISKYSTEYCIIAKSGDKGSMIIDCEPVSYDPDRLLPFDKNSHIIEITVEKSEPMM